MDAATYVRLSASRLGEEAPGLDRQRDAIAAKLREKGWTERPFHDADVSAFTGAPRPGWEALRSAVEAREVGAVVVWKLDRAFRDTTDGANFLRLCRDRDVAFVTVQEGLDTSTPWGPVLFALFNALAEMESQTRRDRTRAWHDGRAKAGKPVGGGTRPYGFREDRVTHDPAERRKLQAAARRLLAGESSLRREAQRLGLSVTGLKRTLTSPRAVGLREHNGSTYPAEWKPLLDEETWLALSAKLDRRGPNAGRRYLLTGGLAFCGLCGTKLVARPRGDGRRCYVCPPDGGCGKIRVLAAELEEFVAGEVARDEERHPRKPVPDTSAEELRTQLAADERALEDLARDRYVRRSITDAEFQAAREGLVDAIAVTQEALRVAETPRFTIRRATTPAPWEVPPGTDPDPTQLLGWRQWVEDRVERVTIGPAVRGLNRFDPKRVEISWREVTPL